MTDAARLEPNPTSAHPVGPTHPDVPTSARRQATRDRLLDAATEVFAGEGLQGASVEAICAHAGFTRGAFYSNFESKEELFLALLEREFDRRARELEGKTEDLAPSLRSDRGAIDSSLAAEYIARFLQTSGNASIWHLLETEYALLAMRDPDMAGGYSELLSRSRAGMTGLVEAAIGAAGRRFTLPAEHAVAIMIGEYESALRAELLDGAKAPGGLDRLPARISELLFAITVESPHGST